MAKMLELGDLTVDIVFKDIQNVHLSVYPPTGRVRISAPRGTSLERLRLFAISKLDWIKREQISFLQQARETPREYLERESHYLWGRRYLLHMVEADQTPRVELSHNRLMLTIRPGTAPSARESLISAWYRYQLRLASEPLVSKWEPLMGVNVNRTLIQRMKTKWGSCNPYSRNIRLNTELAKKPPECLEYIIVHEMAHLLVPNHGDKFTALMDRFLPEWRQLRHLLNSAPLSHSEWQY
jgi:predicted metal-dependent hydrolase